MLKQVRDVLAEREAPLLLSSVRETLPNGRNLREFLELSGVIDESGTVLVMPSLESAIEWVEERLLGEVSRDDTQLPPLELHEIELFKGSRDDTMADLRACLEERIYLAGETIYRRGDSDANLYLLRGGEVKIMGYVGNSTRQYHIATFGRGEFFGGLAFLDHRPRGNDAVAARCAPVSSETFGGRYVPAKVGLLSKLLAKVTGQKAQDHVDCTAAREWARSLLTLASD